MKTIAEQLPPEIARQIHPDRHKNEADYWAHRDELLHQYANQWVAFAGGRVIASGNSPVAVMEAGEASGLHPFFVCVGREDEPCRVRRAAFTYDTGYAGEPLPTLSAAFRKAADAEGVVLNRVIPDTGADASVLPWADCEMLELAPSMGAQSLIGGIAGSSAATLAFLVRVELDGRDYPCRVHADFAGSERILGRDVLNQLEILFRGPAGEVVVNP